MEKFVAAHGLTNIDLIYSNLEKLPNDGEEIYTNSFHVKIGGGPPATMINLSRLDVPVVLNTYLGQDIFSKFAQAEYENFHLQPKNHYQGEKIPLAITSVLSTDHDRTFISYKDTSVEDPNLDILYQNMKGAKIVEMQKDNLPLYKKLKNSGSILVLDIGWEQDLNIETYSERLELADYFTPNQKEAMTLTNTTNPFDAAYVLSDFFEQVVIKLDKYGSLIYKQGVFTLIPPIPEFTHVDSTGAGDAFLSGFIYGLFHEENFETSVLMGNILGGNCVTELGCLTAFMNRSQLQNFVIKYQKTAQIIQPYGLN